jgi:hypothetical protein
VSAVSSAASAASVASAAGSLLALEPEPPHAVSAAAMHTDRATAILVLKIFLIVIRPPIFYLAFESPTISL